MSKIENKAERHGQFCVAQIKQKAKSKLSFRDYVSLCELLHKLKDINRHNSSD